MKEKNIEQKNKKRALLNHRFIRRVFKRSTWRWLTRDVSSPLSTPTSSISLDSSSLLHFNPPPLFLSSGTSRGEYGSVKPTLSGTEFYDLHPYRQGQDPKNIDWKIYFKTGDFLQRRYATPQGSLLILYLDATHSMNDVFDGSISKIQWAKTLMLLLTQSALKGGHCVLWKIERNQTVEHFPLISSAQHALTLFKDLHQIQGQGQPASLSTLHSQLFHPLFKTKTHVIGFSDFLRQDFQAFQNWTSLQPAQHWIWVCLQGLIDQNPPLQTSYVDSENPTSESRQGPYSEEEKQALIEKIRMHYQVWQTQLEIPGVRFWLEWNKAADQDQGQNILAKNFDQLYQILSNR